MSNPNLNVAVSVTRWLQCIGAGDQDSARLLWSFLRDRLLRLARAEIGRGRPMVYDEEDVANSVFGALCRGMEGGRYDDLANRDELWRLLAVITVNKSRTLARDAKRVKRGGQLTPVENGDEFLGTIATAELPPDVVLACEEECQRLLGMLEKDELKLVALLKVEGYTNEEIASQLGCSRRAIQRRLNLIRDFWSEELPDES